MANNLAYIAPIRLTKIVQYIVDQREQPGELLWANRLPVVPVNDKEFFARYINRVKIADHIPLNSRARTYKNGHLRIESTELAKIKFGTDWDEEQLADLAAWSAANSGVQGADQLADFLTTNAEILRTGTKQRINYMATGMVLDSYTYHDPNGIQIAQATFGMPSDLKVLVSVFWTDHAASNPFTDMLLHVYKARVRYGVTYDRVTMGQPLFREIIANTNYADLAKPYMPINISAGATNIPQTDIAFHSNLFRAITGLTVEFDDSRYWDQRPDGSVCSFRNQPLNRVIFSVSAWDNTARLGDIGNGIVDETRVSAYTNGNVLGGPLPSNSRGPISYVTGELDPPGLQQWIVQKCWPRRGELYSTSVMKAAADSSTDNISFISPF